MVSGVGKQNSLRINMVEGCESQSVHLSVSHQHVLLFLRIKGQPTAAGRGSTQLYSQHKTHKGSGWICLVLLMNSVYLLPYLSKKETNAVTIGACQGRRPDTEKWVGYNENHCEHSLSFLQIYKCQKHLSSEGGSCDQQVTAQRRSKSLIFLPPDNLFSCVVLICRISFEKCMKFRENKATAIDGPNLN